MSIFVKERSKKGRKLTDKVMVAHDNREVL